MGHDAASFRPACSWGVRWQARPLPSYCPDFAILMLLTVWRYRRREGADDVTSRIPSVVVPARDTRRPEGDYCHLLKLSDLYCYEHSKGAKCMSRRPGILYDVPVS